MSEKGYVCSDCNKVLRFLAGMRNHIRDKHQRQPYPEELVLRTGDEALASKGNAGPAGPVVKMSKPAGVRAIERPGRNLIGLEIKCGEQYQRKMDEARDVVARDASFQQLSRFPSPLTFDKAAAGDAPCFQCGRDYDEAEKIWKAKENAALRLCNGCGITSTPVTRCTLHPAVLFYATPPVGAVCGTCSTPLPNGAWRSEVPADGKDFIACSACVRSQEPAPPKYVVIADVQTKVATLHVTPNEGGKPLSYSVFVKLRSNPQWHLPYTIDVDALRAASPAADGAAPNAPAPTHHVITIHNLERAQEYDLKLRVTTTTADKPFPVSTSRDSEVFQFATPANVHSAPAKLSTKDLTPHSCVVSLPVMEDGGSKVTKILLHYREKPSQTTLNVDDKTVMLDAQTRSYVVTDLKPDTTYIFQHTVANMMGESDPSPPHTVITPVAEPTNIEFRAVGTDTVTVAWWPNGIQPTSEPPAPSAKGKEKAPEEATASQKEKAPGSDNEGEEVLELKEPAVEKNEGCVFAVLWRPIEQSEYLPECSKEITTPFAEIQGLKPGQKYEFKISARNSSGIASGKPATVSTLAGVPDAPRLVRATRVTSNSMTVHWDPPRNTRGMPLTSYRLAWTKMRLDQEVQEGEKVVSFRYYRVTITKIRNYSAADSMQMSKWYFYFDKVRVKGGIVTAPGARANISTEEATNLITDNLQQKFRDMNFIEKRKTVIVFDFQAPKEVDACSFVTASDTYNRDPVSWVVEASEDNVKWAVIGFANDQATPEIRKKETAQYPLVWPQAPAKADEVEVAVAVDYAGDAQRVARCQNASGSWSVDALQLALGVRNLASFLGNARANAQEAAATALGIEFIRKATLPELDEQLTRAIMALDDFQMNQNITHRAAGAFSSWDDFSAQTYTRVMASRSSAASTPAVPPGAAGPAPTLTAVRRRGSSSSSDDSVDIPVPPPLPTANTEPRTGLPQWAIDELRGGASAAASSSPVPSPPPPPGQAAIGNCTFLVTGAKVTVEGTYFECETCGVALCPGCQDTCHGGHVITGPHDGRFYCECGGSISCEWTKLANPKKPCVHYKRKHAADGPTQECVVMIDGDAELASNPCVAIGGLEIGTWYQFSITCATAAGESKPRLAELVTLPPSPTELKITDVDESTGRASWKTVPLPDLEYVLYTRSGTKPWERLTIKLNPVGTYLTGLPSGSQVQFKVRSVNAGGEGLDGEIVTVTTKHSRPAPPHGIEVLDIKSNTFVLKWQPPPHDGGTPIIGYKVRKSITGAFDAGTNTGSTICAARLTALSAGTKYNIVVRAINGSGESEDSIVATATTTAGAPDPPSGLVQKEADSSSITVQWVAPARNGGSEVIDYKIFRKKPGEAYDTTIVVPAARLECKMFRLPTGQRYVVKVRARSAVGESVDSPECEIHTNAPHNWTKKSVGSSVLCAVCMQGMGMFGKALECQVCSTVVHQKCEGACTTSCVPR